MSSSIKPRTPRLRLIASLVLAAASLSGCITLLPKATPAQLYRFGWTPGDQTPAPGAASPGASGQKVIVAVQVTGFEAAAAGDGILTLDGDRAAQIAGARWVSPAQTQFQQALSEAIDARGGALVRLARGEPAAPAYRLNLEVQRFEVRYDHGPGAAPAVVVQIQAALDKAGDPAARRAQTFTVTSRAGDNRVGAIVPAFDAAVTQAIDQLIAWAQPA